jgi:hypothetical protein
MLGYSLVIFLRNGKALKLRTLYRSTCDEWVSELSEDLGKDKKFKWVTCHGIFFSKFIHIDGYQIIGFEKKVKIIQKIIDWLVK